MRYRIALMLLVLLRAAGTAAADPSVTEEAAVALALENNRDLAASRARVEEVRATLVQAGLWPNPELEIAGRFDSAFANEGEYGFSTGLTQPFSLSGRIGARKGVALAEIDLTLAEVADRERLLAGEVRRVFTEALAAAKRIELQKFLVGLNEELLDAVQAAWKSAQVSEKDVNAVRIAAQQAVSRVTALETERGGRLIALRTLMAAPPGRDFVPDGGIEYREAADPATLTIEKARENRPDLAATRLEQRLARAEKALAEADRIEDLRIGLAYEREKSVVDGAPAQAPGQFLGLKLSIPLPLFDRQQGRILETEARDRRAEKTIEALEAEIEREVADASNRLRGFASLIASYQPGVLQRAEENVKLVENAYRQGQTSIVDVIQSRQQFAELKSSYLEGLSEYRLALIDLETACGIFPGRVWGKTTEGRNNR